RPGEPTPHQKALFFTLRGLTNEDPGPTVEDWKRLFVTRDKVTLLRGALQHTGGIAADGKGNVFISDLGRGLLIRLDDQNNQSLLLEKDGGFHALAFDQARNRLIGCQTSRDRIVAVDVPTGAVTVLAERSKDKPIHAPSFLTVDRRGGIYFTDTSFPTL